MTKIDMFTLFLFGFFIPVYATVCVHALTGHNVGQSVLSFLGS